MLCFIALAPANAANNSENTVKLTTKHSLDNDS